VGVSGGGFEVFTGGGGGGSAEVLGRVVLLGVVVAFVGLFCVVGLPPPGGMLTLVGKSSVVGG
jgi:hypothetical protein